MSGGRRLASGSGPHPGSRSWACPLIDPAKALPFGRSEWPDGWAPCLPGTLIAVEPMIAVGSPDQRHTERTWPIFTGDGSMSVHYEHDVLITEDGQRVLTEGLETVTDVIA